MELIFSENLTGSDRVVRTLVGVTLVGLILVLSLSSTEIAALCLVAAYPLFTALIGWDPIVAVASMIGKQIDPTEMPAPKKL